MQLSLKKAYRTPKLTLKCWEGNNTEGSTVSSNNQVLNNVINLCVLFLVYRIPRTVLRINKVQIVGDINEPPTVSGLKTAILWGITWKVFVELYIKK